MSIKSFFNSLVTKSVWSDTFSILGSDSHTNTPQELYFGIVYSCIDAIANAVSDVEWGLYQKKGNEWNKLEDHPVIELLENPNSFHTFTDFMYLISTHIDTHGNSFIVPVRTALESRNIIELKILNPNNVVVEPDENDYPAKYKYTSNGKIYTYKREEIINVLRSNPFKQYLGLSTIQMARYEGTNEVNSLNYNNSFYKNGAIPGGVISTDKELNADVFQKLKSKIKQQYEGAENFFRLMFLTHGFKYTQTSSTQKDMEYIAQRKLNRDQILAIFKTPKTIVAVSDSVNKATADVEYSTFMRSVIKPRAELIFDKLNKFLLPFFGLDLNQYQLKYKNPVPDDKEYSLDHKNSAVNVWKTVNEIRADEGLEPLEGGDELKMPEKASSPDEDNQEEENDKDKEDKDEGKKKISECTSCTKEGQPKPTDTKRKANQEYIRRKNKYFTYKENQLSLKLSQHFAFMIRDLKKVNVKSNVSNDNPDLTPEEQFELSPEMVEDKLLPDDKKLNQWKILLFLMLYEATQQVYLTALKQLKEAVGYKVSDELSESLKSYISNRAKASSKSVGDTVLKEIRKVVKDSVSNGETDLKKIKEKIVNILKDQKQWKVDQIARTELSWAYGEAERKTYLENGVTRVEWLCGSEPCPTCQMNCGKIVEIDKMFPSGHDSEPVHPNCTCTILGLPNL